MLKPNNISTQTNTLLFSLKCKNPSTTKPTEKMDLTLLNENKNVLRLGQVTIETNQGSKILETSFLCDSNHSNVLSKCTLEFTRINEAEIKSILIQDNSFDFSEVKCENSKIESCSPNSDKKSFKLTFGSSTNEKEIEIEGIKLRNPKEHSEIKLYITTYTEDEQKYKIDEGLIEPFAFPCDWPCKECKGNGDDFFPNECTSCTDEINSGSYFYLYNDTDECKVVIDDCGSGYFKVDKPRQCILCSSKCQECDMGAEICTKCTSDEYLEDKKCVDECSASYYPETINGENICTPCKSGCSSCESLNKCTACYSDFSFYEKNWECLSSCPSRTFRTTNVPPTCEDCDKNCLECKDKSDTCTSKAFEVKKRQI